ncbi:hypothetical protein PSCICJ_29500 [Pseudomonas cichorii]|uniref:hypothetical protein n=1 Tax=Pseudomonas cichorii TaxID=36746 RepID=UPI0019EE2F64|nr:hypothetical protein [Pseudomonas cichorii]GFM66832.1 hypothetical protein PSCICJ_29500 [Pseudomonas cichorii]
MTLRLCVAPAMALAGCLLCEMALGQACDVVTRPASAQVPVIQPHICYEYKGMPEGAIDWSCSNEDKGSSPKEKRKVDTCPEGAVASCRATATTESLANERSTSKEPGDGTAQVPDGAQVVTWYYEIKEQAQARNDCEQSGGTFSYPLEKP